MNYYKIHHTCGPLHHMPSMCKTFLTHPRRDRGNLRLLVLQVLQGQPQNGYGIIKTINEKYGYAPDPASLYPTLQLLQDQGCVEVNEQENKKVYALTDEGKEYLQENSERIAECQKASANLSGTRFPESANELHRSPAPSFRTTATSTTPR